VLESQLLHDEQHPARKLLNRMSTAAVAIDPATESGRKLATEIDRVVKNILADFDSDMAVFSSSVQEFEQFLTDYLRQDNRQATRGIEAVETAEKFSVLLTNVTQALCDVLLPLNVDKRISDFIILIWPHVLVRAALQDAENHIPSTQADSAYRRYRGVLPDLLWSIQEKADAFERTALIRMLPDLIKSLRMALNLIQLPEEESREILDQLVAMHTQVLRSNPLGAMKELPSLEELRQDFSRIVISWDRASWELSEPPQPRTTIIEEIFAKHDISVELNLGLHTVASALADREFLAQTYLLGTRVEFRPAKGTSPLSAQLVWISTHRSLYLFKQDGTSTLVLYTFASLLEALRDETIIPLEYAPVFERAVESLLYGAGRLQDVSTEQDIAPPRHFSHDGAGRLFDNAVARVVLLSRQLHAMLHNEGRQQRVHRLHDAFLAMDFKYAMLFNCPNALVLDIAGDYSGEGAPQIGREQMRRLALLQMQIAHVLMGRNKRFLKLMIDFQ
jgi:hypothetical protein